MSNYAERLAIELRNAYEAHDRDAHDRALRRMVATMTYTGPVGTASATEARAVIDRIAGTPTCSRAAGCECKTWPQAKTCMHRRA